MRYLFALAVIFSLSLISGSEAYINPAFIKAFPQGNNKDLLHVAQSTQIQTEPYVEPSPMEMACPTLPAPADTDDINHLKPGNVKVVMSMGDSITAAMSAKDTLLISLKEYRGISYAIGGDKDVTTMANLLKHYNAGLVGQATGTGLRTAAGTGFNAAVSGALNVDMPGQAKWLVEQLTASTKVNMQNDWKVLTIWIGSNDLCAICKSADLHNALDHEKRLTEALDIIYTNIPKVFVNLVANLDVSKLNNFTGGACGSLHLYECGCTSSNAKLVAATTKEYQATSYKIAQAFNARKNPHFAVVVQPFLIDSYIYDRAYLSAADCFHPSALCHKSLSIALWNNMISPAAQKKHAFVPGEEPLCANADTLLYTN